MKNSRSAWPKGCPLQLAPIPLKRLLSETSSPQLERPNSKPLQLEGTDSKPPQLERLQLDNCSEPKKNELTLYDPKAVSQLESNSLLRPKELKPYELRPYELRPYELTSCELTPYELRRVSQLEVISPNPACQLARNSLLTP